MLFRSSLAFYIILHGICFSFIKYINTAVDASIMYYTTGPAYHSLISKSFFGFSVRRLKNVRLANDNIKW